MSMVSCSGMSDAATFLVSVGPAIQKHVQHACPHTDASIALSAHQFFKLTSEA